MRQWMVAAAGLWVVSAAHAQSAEVKLSKSQIEAVKKGVRGRLKDPDSAKFDQPFQAVANASGGITVCGYVNGKNSYGGYTGNVVFGGMLFREKNAFLPIGIGDGLGRGADYAIRKTCENDGISIN